MSKLLFSSPLGCIQGFQVYKISNFFFFVFVYFFLGWGEDSMGYRDISIKTYQSTFIASKEAIAGLLSVPM